jgi:hypothetical protein
MVKPCAYLITDLPGEDPLSSDAAYAFSLPAGWWQANMGNKKITTATDNDNGLRMIFILM